METMLSGVTPTLTKGNNDSLTCGNFNNSIAALSLSFLVEGDNIRVGGPCVRLSPHYERRRREVIEGGSGGPPPKKKNCKKKQFREI